MVQAEIFGIGFERMTSVFIIKDHAQEMENFVLPLGVNFGEWTSSSLYKMTKRGNIHKRNQLRLRLVLYKKRISDLILSSRFT